MQVTCRSCRQPIPAPNVDLSSRVARCEECSAVFSLSRREYAAAKFDAPDFSGPNRGVQNRGGALISGGLAAPPFETTPLGPPAQEHEEQPAAEPADYMPLDRTNVPMPLGITVEMEGQDLLIRRSWQTWIAIFLLFFALGLNGGIVFLLTQTGIAAAAWQGLGPVEVVFLLIPVLFFSIGLGLVYFSLCCFVNTTTIRVDAAQISVSHGPLPWWGNIAVPRAEVVQLFCVERIHRGKEDNLTFTYDVEVVLEEGDRETLVTGLIDIAQALFIEQEIERQLAIEDKPIRGEVRRW